MTTKTKPTRVTEDAPPPTFADIARKKMRTRLEAYRQYARRAADGDELTEADLSEVADLLAVMGLPDFAWSHHVEAMKRHDVVRAKLQAAVDAVPGGQRRGQELADEITGLQAKLRTLMEEQRKAAAAVGKPAAYGHSLAQLEAENPVVIGDIDAAVTLRLEELDKRRAS
jgi:hypothetical protein